MGRCILPVCLLLVITVGCGSRSNLPGDSGTVSGSVLFKNKPIPIGSTVVMVHREQGIAATGLTDDKGKFTLRMRAKPDVLVGEYGVHIIPPGELDDQRIGAPTLENVPETWKQVPMQYWSLASSPEKFVVKPGGNIYNLVLME